MAALGVEVVVSNEVQVQLEAAPCLALQQRRQAGVWHHLTKHLHGTLHGTLHELVPLAIAVAVHTRHTYVPNAVSAIEPWRGRRG